MHPAYELWGNESVVATLRFRDLQRREALAASANGIWMVSASEREEGAVHFDSPGGSIAEYRLAPQGAGSLLLRGSRPLVWLRKSLWTSLFSFVDIAGNEFMRFEVAADRSGKTIVILSDAAVTDPDAALVAVAGHYLTLGTTPTKGAGPSANYRT
ncbi:MAG TPA: hypothetical protein VF190_06320 [Rhodothermales bacterium]